MIVSVKVAHCDEANSILVANDTSLGDWMMLCPMKTPSQYQSSHWMLLPFDSLPGWMVQWKKPSCIKFPKFPLHQIICWWILQCVLAIRLTNPCTRCATELDSFRRNWCYRSTWLSLFCRWVICSDFWVIRTESIQRSQRNFLLRC